MDPRPRYCPERQLPERPYVPGRGPHPSTSLTTLPSEPDPPSTWNGTEHSLRSQPNYRWGIDLYNHGYYWEAHESWEALWIQATRGADVHTFLQGLIQCAAAALKARMDQPAACTALAKRGLAKLSGILESRERFADIDIRAFIAGFRAFVDVGSVAASPPALILADR